MDRKPMLPAAEKFVAEMRAVCAETDGPDDERRWARCRELLADMLQDPAVKAHAQDWPVGGFDGKKVDNLLFYEDPDFGFVINGLIKNPGGLAVPHDHGKAWTVYGVLAGRERVVHLAPGAPGAPGFAEEAATDCGPGVVDVVPPWKIHAEYAGDEKTVAVIVRSQRSGTFEQYRHGPDGEKTRFPGPNQVPYALG